MTDFEDYLSSLMHRLDEILLEPAADSDPMLELARHVFGSGLRTRPVMTAVTYNLTNAEFKMTDELVRLCACIEMIHKASVIIDDLIDGDILRRGVKTFPNRFGSDYSVVYPFYLVAKANQQFFTVIQMAPDLYKDGLIELYKELGIDVSGGMLFELLLEGDIPSFEQSAHINHLKSTTLLRNSLLLGAHLAGTLSAFQYEQLVVIGNEMGHVFQARNDLLSVEPNSSELLTRGRRGTDIAKKRNNLAIAIALRNLPSPQRGRLLHLYSLENPDEEQVGEIQYLTAKSGAIRQIREESAYRVKRAFDASTKLPMSPARRVLQTYIAAYESPLYWLATEPQEMLGLLSTSPVENPMPK